MTTFEHAMLAINGCLAVGVQKRQQWNIVAMAAVSAVVPDWDGLTLLGSATLFDRAHRAWGHNVLVCVLLGVGLGVCDYRFNLTGRVASLFWRGGPLEPGNQIRQVHRPRTRRGYVAWATVSVAAALSHLAADLAFSGGAGLADWELQLGWPFSARGFVYPLVPWGDVGVTMIFVGGMFAMLRWRARVSQIAGATLGLVLLYMLLRSAVAV